eukprot:CAMPEP_0171060712 /NCGR_PEP_ID=MMETSP0766_2-20121228/3996_1 /TAXON_ID=439317 /ORGANISM="Gambierdiscus australes, Strain CAWD 149" /LENGTH=208 /DNA_ID=CAMNT_0011516315 /DNA_START=54 /DNA_END=680 /DNA_ORIENTATION=-
MLRSSAFRVLPQRALAKTKGKKPVQKKAAVTPDVRMVPYIPQELTKETRQFFQNAPRFKALLDLVFSPLDSRDTEDERLEYENARLDFKTFAEKAQQVYLAHERRANERMWRAIQQLPEDLHLEAVASKPELVPQALLFHERHRYEIFSGLNDMEQRKLQCFHNLMHVRYPHVAERKRNPQRFMIPENQVISRQKEAALAKKKLKKSV